MSTAQFWPFGIQLFDNSGNPLAGGFVYTYQAGTTTNQATYTDQSGVTPNTNPVVLDGNGRLSIWLSSSAYKFVIQDSSGNTLKTYDNVSSVNAGSILASMIDSGLAGVALSQNATSKALDVQVDGVSIDVNSSNKLELKDASVTPQKLSTSGAVPVVYKYSRDFGFAGTMKSIPQYSWSDPSFMDASTLPVPSDSPYQIKFSPDGEFLATSSSSSPYLNIYQRSGDAFSKIAQVATVPNAQVVEIGWSPDGNYLSTLTDDVTSPLYVYRRFGNRFLYLADCTFSISSDLGTPGNKFCAFSRSGDFLIAYSKVNHGHGGGLFALTKKPPSSVTPATYSGASAAVQALVDPTIVTITSNSPYGAQTDTQNAIDDLASSISTLEATYASDVGNLATSLNGTLVSLTALAVSGPTLNTDVFAWGPDDSFLSLNTTSASNYYTRADETWTQTTGIDLTAYSSDTIYAAKWSPNGKYVAVLLSVSPYILVYYFDGSTFTKLSDPSTLPTGAAENSSANCIDWSTDSAYVAFSMSASPYLGLYSLSGSGASATLTKVTDPSTLPGDAIEGVTFSPDKKYLLCSIASSPYVNGYKTASTISAGALLTMGDIINV